MIPAVSSFWTSPEGVATKFTWINDPQLANYEPYFQVRGICFDQDGQILVINEGHGWTIPGGTPEAGETAEQTLRRELVEEADVTLARCWPLGTQKTEINNNPNKKEGDLFYQHRFVGLIDQLLPQTPDPDNGRIHVRTLVPASTITNWVQWQTTGAAMFADAIAMFRQVIK